MARYYALLLALLTSTSASAACWEATLEGGETPFPLTLEIAETNAQREIGLMGRETLDEHAGMLFLFPEHAPWPFWMANTYVNLDIVPLSDDGEILEVLTGVAENKTLLWPAQAINRVLEVNAGTITATGATHLVLGTQIPCKDTP